MSAALPTRAQILELLSEIRDNKSAMADLHQQLREAENGAKQAEGRLQVLVLEMGLTALLELVVGVGTPASQQGGVIGTGPGGGTGVRGLGRPVCAKCGNIRLPVGQECAVCEVSTQPDQRIHAVRTVKDLAEAVCGEKLTADATTVLPDAFMGNKLHIPDGWDRCRGCLMALDPDPAASSSYPDGAGGV